MLGIRVPDLRKLSEAGTKKKPHLQMNFFFLPIYFAFRKPNRPFPRSLVLLGQNEPCAKPFMWNSEFYLHEREPVEGRPFRMNGFVPRLFDKRRKATQKKLYYMEKRV